MIKKNPNELIGKIYHPHFYHCYDFILECLDVPSLEEISVNTAQKDFDDNLKHFVQIDKAIDYCIAKLGNKHIGIYYQDGIYHNDIYGVRWQNLRTMSMQYNITYWKVNNDFL